MTAEKANKVYTITEEQAAEYKTAGYDIRDNDGKIVAYGSGKSVPYEKYEKLCEENKALREELERMKKTDESAEAAKTAGKKKAGE